MYELLYDRIYIANLYSIIFRENSEDVYAGIEWEAGSPEVKKVIDFLQFYFCMN